jgi:hypothetical protein
MALVNLDSTVKRVCELLGKMTPPRGVEILTYKRNRGCTLMRCEGDLVRVREHGYLEQEFDIPLADLGKPLKALLKREFPRSRKVRVYHIAGPVDLGLARKKL